MSERHLKRFEDPGARAVWAAICALDEALQHEVLLELRRRLADSDDRVGELNRKEARGVRGLRLAAVELGGSPSKRAYRRLRQEHPELDLPADSSVIDWLGGSWNAALERARLGRVPDVDAEVIPAQPRYSDEEIIAAVKECAAEIGHIPSWPQYLHWARRPDVRRRRGARPKSQGPFERVFGGWTETLTAAGLVEATAAGVPTSTGRAYRYSDQQLFAALEEISTALGGVFPSTPDLARERQRILEAHAATGSPPRCLPSHGVFVRRFGSWPATRWAFENHRAPEEAE